MGWGGMDKEVENIDKLATGLQHVVTGATADSVLLVSCIAVAFKFPLYEQTNSTPFALTKEL